MKLTDAKREFISAWGSMSSAWNVSRAMAEIHGFLLVTTDPVSADGVMEEMQMSRGTVNSNIRDLIDWGLVTRKHLPGERREYFTAEKDFWKIAVMILVQRRRKELDPLIKITYTLNSVDDKAFTEMIKQLKSFGEQADKIAEIAIKSDRSWFFTLLKKIIR